MVPMKNFTYHISRILSAILNFYGNGKHCNFQYMWYISVTVNSASYFIIFQPYKFF